MGALVSESNPLFGPILEGRYACIQEYKIRKSDFQIQKVNLGEVASFEEDGWEQDTTLKSGVKMKKLVTHDHALENAIWCILYHLGYENMNSGRQFKIQATSHANAPLTKQIDVYAEDGQTVVVVECKSAEKFTKRSLQKEIGEFASLQKPLASAVKSHRSSAINKRFIWILATKNISWSNEDLKRAAEQNIQVVREQESRYFSELAQQIGPAGRYQFHANFLSNSKAMEQLRIPALKTKLGGNTCYFFVAPPSKILPIAFVSHRDLKDPQTAPSYQRLIKRARLKSIAAYIQNGGYFPNALLANFKVPVNFEPLGPKNSDGATAGSLILPSTYKSMWIIDGQHRLYGYAEHGSDNSETIPVVAFEELGASQETQLFKTINSEQRKVSSTLIDQLKGDQDLESPDEKKRLRAIAVRSIEQLRQEQGGPFFQRFKDADLPSPPENQLTISEIANAIISAGLVGKTKNTGDLKFIQGPFYRDLTATTVNALTGGLSAYFQLVSNSNRERWEAGKGSHLCVNVAVQGYIRLFAELIEFLRKDRGLDGRELTEDELVHEVSHYLEAVLSFNREASESEFNRTFAIQYGSGAIPAYYFQLALLVNGKNANFKPTGLDDFIRENDETRRDEADSLVRIIQSKVPEFVVQKLKGVYGEVDWLKKACKNKEVISKAFAKSLDEDEAGPIETYLDFLDFKKIVESTENWQYFSDSLNIMLETERKGSAKYLKWFDEVNRIRRIPAHPYGKTYKDEDVELLRRVGASLLQSGVYVEE
jgi:DNA sulfur modification protein DndB